MLLGEYTSTTTIHLVAWEKNWAVFFGKLLRGVLEWDREANGTWDELDAAAEQVIRGVVPRLLGFYKLMAAN